MASGRDANCDGWRHALALAVNEYGEVLDVLLQESRNTGAAKRFFRRLIDDQKLPERIVTDTPFGAQAGFEAMARHLGSYPSWTRRITSLSQLPSARTPSSSSHTALPEIRSGSKEVSEQQQAPKPSSSPMPKSRTCSTIPVPVHRRSCAVATGCTALTYGASCRFQSPRTQGEYNGQVGPL